MKPDMDQVVRWAQESGMKLGRHDGSEHFYWEGGEFVPTEKLLRLVALAYEAGARAEREKAEEDAKRYRWLRDAAESADWEMLGYQDKDKVDEAIDAFRAGTT